MKKYFVVILVAISINSCKTSSTEPEITNSLAFDYTLKDTLGNLSSSFHPGANFFVNLKITNHTKSWQLYRRINGGPLFTITRGDSIICTSEDGIPPTTDSTMDTLQINSSISTGWKAPNPFPWQTKIILSPGSYSIKAVTRLKLINATATDPADIVFSVIQ